MHAAHRDFIRNKRSPALRETYLECKRAAQKRLRLKKKWWEDKAAELQGAADTPNTKAFSMVLKACMARARMDQHQSSQPTTLLLDKTKIFSRWAEHFNALFNKQSVVSEKAVLDPPGHTSTTYASTTRPPA